MGETAVAAAIAQTGLVLVVISMGAPRVYLGLNWPSDVGGSYVLGVMALIGRWAFETQPQPLADPLVAPIRLVLHLN